MDDSPDVQNFAAPHKIPLSRVGVRRVRKPVVVQRPGVEVPQQVVANFNLFVDLPATQKGTHMSRNVEALADVLDEEILDHHARSLENLCARLASKLLVKHDYAQKAHVEAEGDLFLTQTNPGGKPTIEHYTILARAMGERDQPVQRRLGIRAIGMSACPCAMETARYKFTEEGRAPNPDLPFITHNQRNIVTVEIALPEGEDIEAADLVALAESSLSAPTYEYLKRGDEGELVIQAHQDPKFVEDVVRDVLQKLAAWNLPDATEVFASSDAEESIHKHNAYAECRTTLGDLRS